MVQNVCEETTEDLRFVENNNFIRGSTEAAVRRCSEINAHENTHDVVLLQ